MAPKFWFILIFLLAPICFCFFIYFFSPSLFTKWCGLSTHKVPAECWCRLWNFFWATVRVKGLKINFRRTHTHASYSLFLKKRCDAYLDVCACFDTKLTHLAGITLLAHVAYFLSVTLRLPLLHVFFKRLSDGQPLIILTISNSSYSDANLLCLF